VATDDSCCFNCGYNIAHVGSRQVCPECGNRAMEERDVLDGASVAGRRDRFCQHVVVALVILAVVVLMMRACGMF
jgi:hypothetical protein